MRLATRQDIIDAPDLRTEAVPTPEWGEDSGVYVRSLGALERDQWDKQEYSEGKPQMVGYKARFCVLTIVDENGIPLFGATDADTLAKKSAGVIERVFTAAAKLNGLLAADVAVIEKNSDAASMPV